MPPTGPVVGRVKQYVKDPATGEIYELGGGASSLDGLSDVTIYPTGPSGPSGPSGPADGSVLTWDETLEQWVPGVGGSEVEVGPTQPVGDWELWVDTVPVPAPIPTDEIYIGPDDPRVTDPTSTVELWYDTSTVV